MEIDGSTCPICRPVDLSLRFLQRVLDDLTLGQAAGAAHDVHYRSSLQPREELKERWQSASLTMLLGALSTSPVNSTLKQLSVNDLPTVAVMWN